MRIVQPSTPTIRTQEPNLALRAASFFKNSLYHLLRAMQASTPLTTRTSPCARAFLTISAVRGIRSCSNSVKTLSNVSVDGESAEGLYFSRSSVSSATSCRPWLAPWPRCCEGSVRMHGLRELDFSHRAGRVSSITDENNTALVPRCELWAVVQTILGPATISTR